MLIGNIYGDRRMPKVGYNHLEQLELLLKVHFFPPVPPFYRNSAKTGSVGRPGDELNPIRMSRRAVPLWNASRNES